MPRRYFQSLSPSGFVLLQALWLLLLASLLASIVMALSLSSARDGAAATAVFHAEAAAESALHKVLYELLADGQRSAWAQEARTVAMTLDGAEVSVTVRDANGLLDINAAGEADLRRLMLALPSVDANTILASIKAARPIVSHAAFAALEGMSPDAFASLLPHVTLFSRQSLPSSDKASAWLARVLRLEKPVQGVLTDTAALPGRVFRIEAVARTGTARSQRLDAEILITGKRDRPYLVYEWSWRPLSAGHGGNL